MTLIPSVGSPELRAEIAHLRTLATLTTDGRVLAELAKLISQLESRIHRNGPDAPPAQGRSSAYDGRLSRLSVTERP
jgi:hypothetical protein